MLLLKTELKNLALRDLSITVISKTLLNTDERFIVYLNLHLRVFQRILCLSSSEVNLLNHSLYADKAFN